MKKLLQSNIFSVGLAIFSMFFGAGDLIFAVFVGKTYQAQTPLALTGFLVTAVCLPVLGVISILAYRGDYLAFFGRLGKFWGTVLALVTLTVIAPLVAMPRIVTLSQTVVEPLVPVLSLPLFAVIFLGVTFLLTMSESKIIDILGYWVSPILVVSLLLIFGAALFQPGSTEPSNLPAPRVLLDNLMYGYNTLNFLTSIFFGAFVISILTKAKEAKGEETSERQIVSLGFQGSVFGVVLLGLIYIGLALTGSAHSQGMAGLNEGEVFSQLMFRMLGDRGGIVLAVAVLMACLSTIIALAAVSAEFLHEHVFRGRLNYASSLVLTLVVSGLISVLGLSAIIDLSRPIISILHPVVITLAIVNLLYKWFDFKPVKIPVFLALLFSMWLHTTQVKQFAQVLMGIF